MPTDDTRNDLLAYILAHGGASVTTLATALSLADATVRRHLDRMEAEGLLRTRLVRQSTGRPYHVYEATDAGVRKQRDHSAELAARLLGRMAQNEPERQVIAEALAEDVVADHRAAVRSATSLEERVARTVAALRNEGILDAWEHSDGRYLLHNHACPYRSAADTSDCVCESDRLAIEKLIGVTVNQVGSLVHGDATCEYVVEVADVTDPARNEAPGSASPR